MSRLSSSSKTKTPFLPESFKAFLARRTVDSAALILGGLATFWVISILSYSPTDPSFNATASHHAIANKGGVFGSTLSDFMIQSLGYSSFVLGFIPLVWAVKIFRRQNFSLPLAIRIGCLLIGSLCLSICLARIPVSDSSQTLIWGGAVGGLGLNAISGLIPSFAGEFSFTLTSAVFGLIGAVCLGTSFGFTRASWKRWGLYTLTLMRAAFFKTCAAVINAFRWIRRYDQLEATIEGTATKKPSKVKEISDTILRKAKESPASAATAKDATPVRAAVIPQDRNDPEIVKPSESKAVKKPVSKQKTMSFGDLGDWEFPPLDILQEPRPEDLKQVLDEKALQRNADLLTQVLADFNVEGEIVKIRPGPVVTLYELEPAAGVKSSRIIGLADDIARSMSAISVRVAVVPGRNVLGIEIPNQKRQIVYMRDLVESSEYNKSPAHLPMILGKNIGGQAIIADLAKMPHLLVAGTTGSGKSVAINTMILSLVYQLPPEKCRMIMIDPKMLELSVYDDIPHLLSPVVTDPGRAVVALKWAVQEMENRYKSMSKFGVRNIDGYNKRINEALKSGEVLTKKIQTGFDPESGKPVFEEQAIELEELPYIVVVVDEFADLMMVAGKDVENSIQRLAQMARAAGIHLIMATQRPSVDVITGVIKANFPTRISFQVSSKFDSRTILGDGGAEQLLGMGDMLYMASGGKIQRVHGPFVADDEVEQVVAHLKTQGEPSYLNDVLDDDEGIFGGMMDEDGEGGSAVDALYDEAVALIAREGKASTSFIQRHLQIGYNRAARIIEEMEKQGVVSAANHVGKREILVSDHSSSAA